MIRVTSGGVTVPLRYITRLLAALAAVAVGLGYLAIRDALGEVGGVDTPAGRIIVIATAAVFVITGVLLAWARAQAIRMRG